MQATILTSNWRNNQCRTFTRVTSDSKVSKPTCNQRKITSVHDLNYSVSSGNLLLTDKKTGEMFSYEDEPQKLENASAGRLKVSQPALHCPTCASRMISYVRGKRKISIPFLSDSWSRQFRQQYSNLYCNAFRNDAVRHFEAENFRG